MRETLKRGITYEHRFVVPSSKTVPALYPESEEFVAMPEVFATGFLVGLLEWACIRRSIRILTGLQNRRLALISMSVTKLPPLRAWRSRQGSN